MKENLKNILGGLGAVLLVSLILLTGLEVKSRLQGPADITKTRSVTMSAEGKVASKPDTAEVIFSVVSEGVKAEDVQKDNDKKMATVLEFIKTKGVEARDIQTSGYNLYPRYNYNKPSGEAPEITGYTLNQRLTVKVRDLASVSGIVGGLTAKGVNQIENISFYIDDPDALKSEARKKAIEKARAKAEELAAGLGVRLGRVINFTEGAISVPIYSRGYPEGLGGGGAASPVEPGTEDITVSVTLTFELK